MPIYEYCCPYCERIIERLEFSIKEIPTTQCPYCKSLAHKIMSVPAITAEPWSERMSPTKLPNWQQQNKKAEWHDAWMRYRQKAPLPHDRGAGIKVYESEGLKEPK